MGQFPKSPNKVDPVIPSAVSSRTSIVWEGRDKIVESKKIIDDTANRVQHFVQTKLPPEVLKDVDIMASIEDKIYNYVNQSYVNMFNRYTVTVEDEMVKKVREFIDKEELRTLQRYTPREIVEILDKVGGADKFNTGELEKSVVNMYGHLQGHIQRGMNDLENETNSILRQKTDVGAFVRGENAYSIVKCSFKDSQFKPKTVTDIKLSINILDSELISPIFHYQTTVEHLLKDSISKHITELIDREIDKLKEELVDTGRAELSDGEIMFEKIKLVDKYTDDNVSDPNSRRYTILAKKFLDKIEGLRAEIDQDDYDSMNMREQIKKIIDSENIRNRGFNTAVNTLTSILDTSKLGYQVCDNKKNARECWVREYEDQDDARLPDERYAIRLVYLDQNQIRDLKRAYDARIAAFLREGEAVWDVVHEVYDRTKKRFFGLSRVVKDFEDLARSIMPKAWVKERTTVNNDPDEIHWDKLRFRDAPTTFVEKNNRTYSMEVKNVGEKIRYLRDRLQTMYGYQNPVERVVIDERLNLLEQTFNKYIYEINPHHLQPGLILDVDITTTKRKMYMMKSMANVLNEFLSGVSQGFADAAFASFKRRRSTVRADIEMTFSQEEHKDSASSLAYKGQEPAAGSMYAAPSAPEPQRAASAGGESGVRGSADVTPKSYEDKLKEMGLKEL
ncbi:MAG TPA: cytoplasmic filament protein CfpA [Leptospiraceae bacterium]|nr:cytochrome C oxidase subunit II [Leptospirales bacterium]HMU83570.1 cytoplasmic filament protein CfpA [Leptospiraceae bacterium]HMX57110.1 cytoplasmic filament protein CfpA [Leptospiraceae bacterium]HMY46600.1 cytoplasmic filament protein CfpA [Leptospiraceae bacterium]HNE24716.1 cytoplasmic filament protein CfpA [Leptospiraceae bacterium]